jgi:hypothetical protein
MHKSKCDNVGSNDIQFQYNFFEITYFIKPQNPKPYQALAHNKKKCTYIKGLMGHMGSSDILLVIIMEQTHFIKPQTLNPIKP